MQNFPLVSIIIPAYNVQDYIAEAIESVLNQRYNPIEIIVVNDGSTDDTLSVLTPFIERGVRVISQENKGLSEARNTGLRAVRGELVGFLDGDDLLSADVLEKNIPFFTDETVDVVQFPIIFDWQGPNERMIDVRVEEQLTSLREICQANMQQKVSFSVCDKIFRCTFFEKHNFASNRLYEDMFFWSDRYEKGSFCLQISTQGRYFYRSRQTSIVRSVVNLRKAYDFIEASMRLYAFGKKIGVLRNITTAYFVSVILDLSTFDIDKHLSSEEKEKVYSQLRLHYPSKFILIYLCLTKKLKFGRYKLLYRWRKRMSIVPPK